MNRFVTCSVNRFVICLVLYCLFVLVFLFVCLFVKALHSFGPNAFLTPKARRFHFPLGRPGLSLLTTLLGAEQEGPQKVRQHCHAVSSLATAVVVEVLFGCLLFAAAAPAYTRAESL